MTTQLKHEQLPAKIKTVKQRDEATTLEVRNTATYLTLFRRSHQQPSSSPELVPGPPPPPPPPPVHHSPSGNCTGTDPARPGRSLINSSPLSLTLQQRDIFVIH
jgi:hypothetical protein